MYIEMCTTHAIEYMSRRFVVLGVVLEGPMCTCLYLEQACSQTFRKGGNKIMVEPCPFNIVAMQYCYAIL